jgi:hypothetical protein
MSRIWDTGQSWEVLKLTQEKTRDLKCQTDATLVSN